MKHLSFRTIAVVTAVAVLMPLHGQVQAETVQAVKEKTLTIKGSDTMIHLVTAWTESFMKARPEATISVTGGGSGTGIAALLNGTAGLCMASRELNEQERKLAASKGIDLTETVVGRDGISVIVNAGNPIKELSMEQLRSVFTGKATNWKELGGVDLALQAFSRESSSGTYAFFLEKVLSGEDYGAEVRLLVSNSAIVQAVAEDRGGIGYVGLGYAKSAGIRVVGIRGQAGAAPVLPSAQTVVDGSYPIARQLYLYSNGTPKGLAKDFLDRIRTPAGQKILVESGYVPVK
jgi:phosphate transport system substrate-binding protein